jgi:oligopeptide/dipeptide ABC transporter ATP-binding protein
MALLAKPALLLADEPTTALDATLEAQIVHRLRQLQKDLSCSILFVSHHLGLIAELCDQVVVMYAGEVVEAGDVRDIFHRAGHPYTQALLECDPARIEAKTRNLPTIPGDIPDLANLPSGCIFENRCSKRLGKCRTSPPRPYRISPTHTASCFLLADGGAR